MGIGLIRRGAHFLIRRRPAGTAMAGAWEFPGGKCEPGETPREAAARECHEEIGLSVTLGALRRVAQHTYPHGKVELHYFDGTLADQAAEPDRATGFVWRPGESLPELPFPEANEPVLLSLAREYPDPPG